MNVYGADSYVRAGKTLQYIQHGNILDTFEPGIFLYSAAASLITGQLAILSPVKLAAVILAPFSTILLARFYLPDHSRDDFGVRFFIFMSVFFVEGFGAWLSTKASAHPFFLAIPLAIVFLALVQWEVVESELSIQILGIATGFAVSLYHPLLFLLCLPVLVIGAITRGVDESPTFVGAVNSSLTKVKTSLFLILPALSYLAWFQVLNKLVSSTGYILGLLGVTALPWSSSVAPTCVSTPPSPMRCDVMPTLFRNLPLFVIFGACAGLVGITTIHAVRRIQSLSEAHQTLRPIVSPFLFFSLLLFGVATILVGILPHNLSIRVLGFYIALSPIILIKSIDGESDTLGIGREVYVLVLILIIVLFVIGQNVPQYLLIYAVIASVSVVCGGFLAWRVPYGSHLVFVFLIVFSAITVPLLYPNPSYNNVANLGGSQVEESQLQWAGQYISDEKSIATRQRSWAVSMYLESTASLSMFQGSTWRLQRFAIDNETSPLRTYATRSGERAVGSQLDYVLVNGLSSDHVKSLYWDGNELLLRFGSVSDRDVQASYPSAGRVYVANNETSVWHIPV